MARAEKNRMGPVMSPRLVERYLAVLGVERREPGLDALTGLVQAHLFRVPFENVSKLYYKKHRNLRGIPSLEIYLEGIERSHFGGTCYSNNYYFCQLLTSLGYDARVCGADMSSPDVHLVSMVKVQGREYLVDVGYAAPFWFPMPRDLTEDYVIELGADRYLLKPQDAQGRSRLEFHQDGSHKHGYLAKPGPRHIHEFEGAILDSFQDDSTFMNALLVARYSRDESLVVRNLTATEYEGNSIRSRLLAGRDEAARLISDRFGIPEAVVEDAVGELGTLRDTWS